MTVSQLFDMDFVRGYLFHGGAYWRPDTGECVFRDPDLDDVSFCVTWIDLGKVDGSVWDGYSSSRDDGISLDVASYRIVTEDGWRKVPGRAKIAVGG